MSVYNSKSRLSNNTQRIISSAAFSSSVSKRRKNATPSTISTKGTSTTISSTPDTHHNSGLYSTSWNENETEDQNENETDIENSMIDDDDEGSETSFTKSDNNHIHSYNAGGQQKQKPKPKDASDILAQWRKERQEDQQLQGMEHTQNRAVDATNRNGDSNGYTNGHEHNRTNNHENRNVMFDGDSKVGSPATHHRSLTKSPEGSTTNNTKSTSQRIVPSSHNLHSTNTLAQTPVVGDQEGSSDETNDDGGIDTSVVTTPTGNTALNSVGMNRLYSNMNNSSGIRLFPASQEGLQPVHRLVNHHDTANHKDQQNNKRVQHKGQEVAFQPIVNNEFHGGEGNSVDVSLMTQDTDMIFLEVANRETHTHTKTHTHTEEASTTNHNPAETGTLNRHNHKSLHHKYNREQPNQRQTQSQSQPGFKQSCKNYENDSGSNRTADTSSSANPYHGYHGSNTVSNQNDVTKVVTTLQSSLEQSRIIRSGQEKELIHNKDIISQLKQQNQLVIKESSDYKNSLCNSIGELLQHVNGLQDCLSFDGDDQPREKREHDLDGIKGSVDEIRALREISDVMKQLVVNKMPYLLEQLHENTDQIQAAKSELKRVCAQVRKAKERQEEQTRQHDKTWALKQQQINQEHLQIQSKIQIEQKKLELVQTDLSQSDQISACLRDTQQKLEQHRMTLSNINTQVSAKREELSDIEKLCEERIQSAHSIEISARESVKEARNEKRSATKTHEAAVKKLDAIKCIEKAAKLEQQELDSDRLAWGAELSLKQDQITIELQRQNEERQELKVMEESLLSRRSQLKAENDRVKSVQNQLLEIEAVTEEKLLILNEKEAGIMKREDDICNVERKLVERKKNFDLQLAESDKRSNELLSVETDLNDRLISLQQDQEEFKEEQQRLFERLTAFEKLEIELEADRNELTIKASNLSTTVKSAKEDTEKRRQQLDQFECQLREKEKTLTQQSSVISSQEKKFTENLKELALKEEKLTNDSLNFERNLKEEKAEHTKLLALTISNQVEEETRLKNITQSKIKTEKSYKKLSSDVLKVKEAIKNKVNDAQLELHTIDHTIATKKNELMGLQGTVQHLSKEVDDSNKAKNDILDNIRRKEKTLTKIDAQLKSGKEAWDRAECDREKEIESTLHAKMKEADKQFATMREQTVSKMMKISNDLAFKHEEASCKLSSRARQVDLLHSKLSNITRRTLMEQKEIQEYRRAWEEEKSLLKRDLKESVESIRHKDDEISSYLQANTALKASLDSSTAHELILTDSLQTKDKEMHLISQDKRVLDQRVTDYERQLSTLKSSTTELEQVYEEKISSLKVRAEREMKIAITRHDTSVSSLGKIDIRMKELQDDEYRLEKERESFMKRTDALQKSEECINTRIIEMERKESELDVEAKEIHHSKSLLQEERQVIYTKTESLKQKEVKLHDETLEFSVRQESHHKEISKKKTKLDECRKNIDMKQKQINEKEDSVERRSVELDTWKSKLTDSSRKSNKKVAVVQTNLLEQEKELKAARTELSDRLKSIKELEENLKSRTNSIKQQEDMMTLKFSNISEKLSIEQEHVSQAKESLKEEGKNSSVRLNELKKKEDEMDSRVGEIKSQQISNAETGKRLKEFAHSLKKQGKDIKVKEKNIQNIARLLKERKSQTLSSDATLIAELQKTITMEQNQYQLLVDDHAKQKVDLRAKQEELDHIHEEGANIDDASEESQQRMRQIALQLKQKDEELVKREEALEERISKCDECEATLAAWNMKLDGMAATFDSTFQRHHP